MLSALAGAAFLALASADGTGAATSSWSGDSTEVIKVKGYPDLLTYEHTGITADFYDDLTFVIEYPGGLTITGDYRGRGKRFRLRPDVSSREATIAYLEDTLAEAGGADSVDLTRFRWSMAARLKEADTELWIASVATARGKAWIGPSSARSAGKMTEVFVLY